MKIILTQPHTHAGKRYEPGEADLPKHVVKQLHAILFASRTAGMSELPVVEEVTPETEEAQPVSLPDETQE